MRPFVTNIHVHTSPVSTVAGMWLALKDVFPSRPIKGCVFHWSQSVWRRVQDLGLATSYRSRKSVYQYVGLLMALPFLPAGHIRDAFEYLRPRATSPQLAALVDYMDRQWIGSTIFTPASWSVFGYSVRTNNDVEGRDV